MSDTAVVDQPIETNTDVALKTSVYAVTKTAEGKIGFGVYKDGNDISKAVADGKAELVFQTEVSMPYAVTVKGMSEILEDEAEAIQLFNNGLAQKTINRVKAYLTEQDAEGNFIHGNESTFDASDLASSPLTRKTLSEAQKLEKALVGASKEDVMAVLKKLGVLI